MNSNVLQLTITSNLQTHFPTLYFCFSKNIKQQMYISYYESLCNMAVTCETGMCHRGDNEDSNRQRCDTLSLGVYLLTSQILICLQNTRKSYRPHQSASDPRRPEFSWQLRVLTSRHNKNI